MRQQHGTRRVCNGAHPCDTVPMQLWAAVPVFGYCHGDFRRCLRTSRLIDRPCGARIAARFSRCADAGFGPACRCAAFFRPNYHKLTDCLVELLSGRSGLAIPVHFGGATHPQTHASRQRARPIWSPPTRLAERSLPLQPNCATSIGLDPSIDEIGAALLQIGHHRLHLVGRAQHRLCSRLSAMSRAALL